MNLPTGIFIVLLLMVQGGPELSLQIPEEYLREQGQGTDSREGTEQFSGTFENTENGIGFMATSSPENSDAVASGFMSFSGDEEPQATNQTSEDITENSMTTEGLPGDASGDSDSENSVTSTPIPSIPLNATDEVESPPQNETTTRTEETPSNVTTPIPMEGPSNTTIPVFNTSSTTKPERNSTEINVPVKPDNETLPSNGSVTNSTENSLNTTTTEEPKSLSTTETPPEPPSETTAVQPPPALPDDDTTTAPTTTTVTTSKIPVEIDPRANAAGEGVTTEESQNKKKQAWGAILGTAVAAGIVALVVYVYLKRRGQRKFSHRKLVEDGPDPVLRLDNSEPLDLKYDFAYYNPGLQGDNIQMTNFPQGRAN